jgi:dTDP-4-amino-4,6-dideoxygalactose transaminase
MVGTFGHVATCSFYPAHHITIGEGGMVVTDDDDIARAVTSIRDWGEIATVREAKTIPVADVSPGNTVAFHRGTIINMYTPILATT